MQDVLTSLGKAIVSQLHPRMLLLTLLPFVLSLVMWGVALWIGLAPTIDWLHGWFTEHEWFAGIGETLGWLGLGAMKTVLVPLLAIWLLVPLMIITALVFVGALAMPAILRHVARRGYPGLDERGAGGFLGSLSTSLGAFLLFIILWIVTLPLALIPPFTFIIQPLLWGWLTYRVMAYDALADHATLEERQLILRRHRWPLLAIGVSAGALGAAPTLLWLGGALAIALLPFIAAGSIWLYVVIFTLSGLWFTHYCLHALSDLRRADVIRDSADSRQERLASDIASIEVARDS